MAPMPGSYDHDFGFLISDVARLVRKHFDRRAACHGLTRVQWRALRRLFRSEGITQAALAEQLEIEPIAVGRVLDRLQTAGFVERRADPADRRVWRLHLTARARAVAVDMERIGYEARRDIAQGIPGSELAAMIALLERLKERLQLLDQDGNDDDTTMS